MRDYTAYGHPVLSVPCPVCGQPEGQHCLRPSGRRAGWQHVARRDLMRTLFLVDYGESARLVQRRDGWQIELGPPAGGTNAAANG